MPGSVLLIRADSSRAIFGSWLLARCALAVTLAVSSTGAGDLIVAGREMVEFVTKLQAPKRNVGIRVQSAFWGDL